MRKPKVILVLFLAVVLLPPLLSFIPPREEKDPFFATERQLAKRNFDFSSSQAASRSFFIRTSFGGPRFAPPFISPALPTHLPSSSSSSSEESSEETSEFPFSSSSSSRPTLFFFTFLTSQLPLPLVDTFLSYYLSLGIPPENIHVDLLDDAMKQDLLALLQAKQITQINLISKPWYDQDRLGMLEAAKERMHVPADAWIMPVLPGEFQEFPSPLFSFLSECDALGISVTQAYYIDRIGQEGLLQPISAETDLGGDFPWACQVTRKALRQNANKLGPFKAFIKPNSGSFNNPNNRLEEHDGLLTYRGLRVHSFKWFKGADLRALFPLTSEGGAPLVEKEEERFCINCPEMGCLLAGDLPQLIPPQVAVQKRMNALLYKFNIVRAA